MTQAELATELDVRIATVSDWERGRQQPKRKTLAAYASLSAEMGGTPADEVLRWLLDGGPEPVIARPPASLSVNILLELGRENPRALVHHLLHAFEDIPKHGRLEYLALLRAACSAQPRKGDLLDLLRRLVEIDAL